MADFSIGDSVMIADAKDRRHRYRGMIVSIEPESLDSTSGGDGNKYVVEFPNGERVEFSRSQLRLTI